MNESQKRLNFAKARLVDATGAINFLKWWNDGLTQILFSASVEAEEGQYHVERLIFEGDDGIKSWLDSLYADGRLGNAVTLLESCVQRGPCFSYAVRPSSNRAFYIVTMWW